MKFLIIEQGEHEEEHHVVEADTFEDALKTMGYDETIEEGLAMAYTCEAFPPTRYGKTIIKFQHYVPEFISVYEIVDQLEHSVVSDAVNKYISDTFDRAVVVEKARREK